MKSMAYDHPAYTVPQVASLGAVTAGAAAATGKFVAFASLRIKSIVAAAIATGTSTYASLWNGTATIATAVGAQTFSLIHVHNTAAAGATPGLNTATWGPFALSLFDGTSTNTQTNSSKPGFANYVPVSGVTGTGTIQAGAAVDNTGFQVNQGDSLYVVQGTDATAVGAYSLEYSIQPLANVT